MTKPKAPEGFPDEVVFCKRRFKFHKSEKHGKQVYKLDHVLIFVSDDPGEVGPYFDAYVCTTSKSHGDDEIEKVIASGSASKVEQAVKRAEKDLQTVYYKIKPLME